MRLLGTVLSFAGLIAQAPVAAPSALEQIRREGLERSQVGRAFDQIARARRVGR